jgi:UDP-N-acetylmuramyl pentapeptide phosphotransferase/UDP-N-acetylglucosamine-1-phosphate transferase
MSGAAAVATGAVVARGVQAVLLKAPPGGAIRWTRTNHRGRPLSLLSGPALAAAVGTCAQLPRQAALVAALGSAAVGAYDDASGDRHPHAKGFRGHLAALRTGQVTGGALKVLGIGGTGLVATRLLGPRPLPEVVLGGAVVAGSANLLNLLDLRPGRALKAGLLAALALGQPGPAAAAAALLPEDLRERTMLGDAGANALGAVLGLALLHRHPRRRGHALAVLVALTGLSEVVSYSRVIDAVPPLTWLDRAGRLP